MPATYEPIATTTLGSGATSITFSSISSAYTDLRLVFVYKKDASINQPVGLQFNGDTATNYSMTYLYGSGTAAGSNRSTSQTRIFNFTNSSDSSDTANLFTYVGIDIFNYAGSTNKTALAQLATDKNGSGSVERQVGLWRSTNAINSIVITTPLGNFSTGTTATLYGILKA